MSAGTGAMLAILAFVGFAVAIILAFAMALTTED